MTFTLLLTCVGDEFAPQVLRTLRERSRHDVAVVGVDVHENVVGRHFVDHFATVPPGDDPGYVDAIAGLARLHDVDVILPKSDEEALALSEARDRLESGGCQLACADISVLRVFENKAETHRRIAEMGLPVPDWRSAESLDELAAAVEAMLDAHHGEAVVKPAVARGGRNVCVIRADISGSLQYQGGREVHLDAATFRRDHLDGFARQLPAVVMERLVEPVYDIDMLAWQGQPVRVVARRRVNSAAPNKGHTIVDNADLIELGEKLIKELGLS